MQPSLGSLVCPVAAAATTLHLVFLFIALQASSAHAELPVFVASEAYDNGTFGRYPVQSFKSSGAIAPRPNLLRQHDACAHHLKTFLTPRGYAEPASRAQATILDQHGRLVWTSGWEDKQIYNLMVQTYRGHKYLTFWAGNDALDETYSLTRKFEAADGLEGDLHDFRVTEQGTALMTVYDIRDHDLSALGKATGPIWDCLIQEIDIPTGNLVFEWRASEHLNVSDTHWDIGGEGEPGGAAFDWFHLNSIDKDPRGNYMVSSRYLHSVTYIHGKTGKVLWVLGGKGNMFTDLSGGNATNFAFQHDARWDSDHKEITLFDNSDVGPLSEKSNPRGMRIEVDQQAMTATLLAEYKNPHRIPAESQGSMQTLPGGNVVIGFGFTGAFTEFDRDGTPLCDTHYGPETGFGSGDVQSYRVLKYAWRGFPATDPDVAVARDDGLVWRAYASWNGATEVTQWELQGTDNEEPGEASAWRVVERRLRDGFETDFVLEADHPIYLRVVGLDYKGNALGTSLPADAAKADADYNIEKWPPEDLDFDRAWTWATCIIAGIGFVVAAVASRPAWKAWKSACKPGHYRRLSIDERNAVAERLA
ncbi:hypothetical protein TOPH_07789 [Tolypocladium ophioglossoides CBS 100239]|uniref:Arylsulfotransferase n=1 Tax=Tolypocladium ophioglossoides (strain CBS 100239) TaxID=1163406 RepID=A0A0L0N192_TOLOC|nr:hypothetical protein TOPH_07789 [Tolypocladium ophioglossoides CBS 100239]